MSQKKQTHMKTKNSFVVTGRIGMDAEIRNLTNSTVAHTSLALTRSSKKGDSVTENTAWLDVEAWSKDGDQGLFENLKKGKLVTIEGWMKPDSFVTKDGVKKSRIVFVATKVIAE